MLAIFFFPASDIEKIVCNEEKMKNTAKYVSNDAKVTFANFFSAGNAFILFNSSYFSYQI
jgi:hypothetical protein